MACLRISFLFFFLHRRRLVENEDELSLLIPEQIPEVVLCRVWVRTCQRFDSRIQDGQKVTQTKTVAAFGFFVRVFYHSGVHFDVYEVLRVFEEVDWFESELEVVVQVSSFLD